MDEKEKEWLVSLNNNLKLVYDRTGEIEEKIENISHQLDSIQSDLDLMQQNINLMVTELC